MQDGQLVLMEQDAPLEEAEGELKGDDKEVGDTLKKKLDETRIDTIETKLATAEIPKLQ